MRTVKFSFTTLDIMYQDGSNEIRTFTPTDLAAFKRSKKYKQILSKKILVSWSTTVKTLDSLFVDTKKKK